jgi:hypothetical protein
MTQLELIAPCRVPKQGTQHYTLLQAFQRGERLTVGVAMQRYQVYALSQRVGDLKHRYGWPIKDRTVETSGGARISEYWLER